MFNTAETTKTIKLNTPNIPIEYDLWSTREIAHLLKRSVAVVRDHIIHLPGFPSPYRIPSRSGKANSHPLWKALEVLDWAENYRDER